MDLVSEIDAFFESTPDYERDYIGASQIGEPCARKVWLQFNRLSFQEKFSGRMLRLFNRGNREESFFEHVLQAIGFKIVESCLEQAGFKSGFFAGHSDGILMRDGIRYVAEYKTHNDKSFKTLVLDGVKEAKPLHYAQMMVYGRKFKCDKALYCAVNKNDDTLHIEVLDIDQDFSIAMEKHAHDLAASYKPPEKIARSASDYRCKMCSAAKQCHGLEPVRIDCRNCTHVDRDAKEGKFSCELGRKLEPCEQHCFNPYAVADIYGLHIDGMDQDTKTITLLNKNGQEIQIGGNGLTSEQFLIKVL